MAGKHDICDYPGTERLHLGKATDNTKEPPNVNCTPSEQTLLPKTSSFPHCSSLCLPCLPVSKGCIKKMAQTRFVNSSPRSYRLMPASVESSDMTSFVEKSSHNHFSPMKFMLEVAELWELSKHSELECNFTLAKSEKVLGSEYYIKQAKLRSPICHSSVTPARVKGVRKIRRKSFDVTKEVSRDNLGRQLRERVKNFFKSQELRERHPLGIAGLINQEIWLSKNHLNDIISSELVQNLKKECGNLSDDDEPSFRANSALTPLVKRLSVSGLDETSISGDSQVIVFNVHPFEVGTTRKRLQVSTKRPGSTSKMDYGEEPLQKALCTSTPVDESIGPG